jgi:AraC-like DNA-binding protein
MPCVENTPDPVAKALWFIENQFAGDISLAEIAHVSGVSRFHLSRAFGLATGHSVMRYVRGRRLSEAARALAAGAPDILALANPDAGIEPIRRAATDIGDGAGRVDGLIVPIAGRWSVRLDVLINDFEQVRLESAFEIAR